VGNNAVGVELFRRNPPWKVSLLACLHKKSSTPTALNLLANVAPG